MNKTSEDSNVSEVYVLYPGLGCNDPEEPPLPERWDGNDIILSTGYSGFFALTVKLQSFFVKIPNFCMISVMESGSSCTQHSPAINDSRQEPINGWRHAN